MRSVIDRLGEGAGPRPVGVWVWLALAAVGTAGCAATPASLRNLDRGCSQGNSTSCVKLGAAFYEGRDEQGGHIDLDYRQARRAFDTGCQKGSGDSCYQLGAMLSKGEGGAVEKPRAIELWRRGCELGTAIACRKTAESYVEGSVSAKNPDLAFAYAKQGCERSDPDSCGLWKQLGGKPPVLVAPAGSEIAALISSCEQQNDGRACFDLGERFDKGTGTAIHKEKAAQSYRFACDKGDLRGCHNLGIMKINAEGIPRDGPGGLLLLNKACESGQRPSCEQMIKTLSMLCSRNDGDACTILGRLYIKGDRGLETNVTKGVEYLQKGCTAGDKDGCDDLRRLGL